VTVDIVVPVHNEQRALPGCIDVLHRYLRDHLPFDWMVTIADSASTDHTYAVAEELATRYDHVRVVRIDHAGGAPHRLVRERCQRCGVHGRRSVQWAGRIAAPDRLGGSSARSMALSSVRCRGRDTAPATHARSMTPPSDWQHGRPRRR
jgi:cellulose synthase/poly-beta-1,6-N-acetylglucosamine synthase-like glycosyltransferase